MNVQTNEVTRTAQGVSSCGFCSQPLFGPVAYCPYCGKANLAPTVRQPEDRHQPEKVVADGRENLAMPTGAPGWRDDGEPHSASRRRPLPSPPAFDQDLPTGRDAAAPSQMTRTRLVLLFTIAAGIGALLFWMLVKLPAPRTNVGASPQPPISAPAVAPPRPSPVPSAAQAPSVPARTDTAAPPQSNRSPLCSPASERAGLCKSQ